MPGVRALRRAPVQTAVLVVLAAAAVLTGGCARSRSSWKGPAGRVPRGLPHAGSAVVVSTEGYALTHRTVTQGARYVMVVVPRQELRHRYRATPVAEDPASGLVLLKVEGETDWIQPWVLETPASVSRATAAGWPVIAACSPPRPAEELVSCNAGVEAGRFRSPLPPGFEGGVVVDGNGDGLGVIGELATENGLCPAPQIVPAQEIRRFLGRHGIQARKPVGYLKRPWRVRLRQLQNCVVLVERAPARSFDPLMPRLRWRSAWLGEDLLALSSVSERDGSAQVLGWRSTEGYRRHDVRLTDGTVVASSDAPAHPSRIASFPRLLRTPLGEYRLDYLGGLTFVLSQGGSQQDLVIGNGFRYFPSRGALEASRDGRWVLAGDAVLYGPTGTVVWRLALRPTEPARLLPDGSALLVGRRLGGSRNRVERWDLPGVTPQ